MESPFHGVRARRLDATSQDAEESDEPLALDRAVQRRVLRDARAYAAVMPPGAMFVGRTAAVLFGLPVAHRDVLDVGAVAPVRAPRARGVRGVKVEQHLVSMRLLDGLPVSCPASTWAMLGRELSVRDLIIAGDAVVCIPRGRHGVPLPGARLATIEQLEDAASAGPRRGAPRLRAALADIRAGSMSPPETAYRLDAAAAGLPTPDLDVEVRDANGRLLGISEVVYSRWRVIVELEGDHHRTSRQQWLRDLDKYAAYSSHGWETVRLTSSHLRSGRAIPRVRDALRRHGWDPTRDSSPVKVSQMVASSA